MRSTLFQRKVWFESGLKQQIRNSKKIHITNGFGGSKSKPHLKTITYEITIVMKRANDNGMRKQVIKLEHTEETLKGQSEKVTTVNMRTTQAETWNPLNRAL